jgi:hypothetical protein
VLKNVARRQMLTLDKKFLNNFILKWITDKKKFFVILVN